ncbi:MAG: cation transporter [Deltaproteobacteria bacterium HGW-Deltaproteobacteria-15]|nr:MAG: cation transporter [Deltaproteobacteria bacterium HGW-Deltaproteobacteria-15]
MDDDNRQFSRCEPADAAPPVCLDCAECQIEETSPAPGTSSQSATGRHRRALWITFALTFSYFIVEVVAGFLTNSLALLADAAHMLTDVGGLALALFASWMASKPATAGKSYGYYRVEILAALVNGVVLFLVSFYILYEGYRRFQAPPEVASLPMLGVAVVGLAVNLFGMWNLHRGSSESLNVQGAFLEVVSDTLGSLGVIAAAGIMAATGWYYADPIFSVLIGLFILPRTWKLMSRAVHILLEGTPSHIDLKELKGVMCSVPGVRMVHHLHVWTITSGMHALSGHVVLADGIPSHEAQLILEEVHSRLRKDFELGHTTIQVEYTPLSEKEPGP